MSLFGWFNDVELEQLNKNIYLNNSKNYFRFLEEKQYNSLSQNAEGGYEVIGGGYKIKESGESGMKKGELIKDHLKIIYFTDKIKNDSIFKTASSPDEIIEFLERGKANDAWNKVFGYHSTLFGNTYYQIESQNIENPLLCDRQLFIPIDDSVLNVYFKSIDYNHLAICIDKFISSLKIKQ